MQKTSIPKHKKATLLVKALAGRIRHPSRISSRTKHFALSAFALVFVFGSLAMILSSTESVTRAPVATTPLQVMQEGDNTVDSDGGIPDMAEELIAAPETGLPEATIALNANPAPIKDGPGSTLTEEDLRFKLDLESVESEELYSILATPNDPIYPQWFSTNMDAEDAWDITTGDSSVVVAVIDSGYALAHEDLNAAWHINSGETGTTADGDICWTGTPEDKQSNNCDDDSNGFTDDWRGWDFSNDDNSPQTAEHGIGSTHGTKVAGLVGGRGNNGIGMAALDWNNQIMPLQGLFDDGYGFTSDIAAAIIYATDNGADVINLSLGSTAYDLTMQRAVQYAATNNVIVVAAAGNCGVSQTTASCLGSPSPGGMIYPARYADVIAVGAVDSSDDRASFSSYGIELEFMAPGSGSIQTTSWIDSNETSHYSTSAFGTSFASPIASSVISLIKAELPTASLSEVRKILGSGIDQVAGMNGQDWHTEYGFGRINALKTLEAIADVQQDIDKGTGAVLGNDVPPQISINTGLTTSTRISSTNQATVLCISSPSTACSFSVTNVFTGTVSTFDSRLTDSQGIASWTIDERLLIDNEYIARVSANGLDSSTIRIYFDSGFF